MDQKRESPVGVYSNLCVIYFDDRCPHRRLRRFDIVPPSPEVHLVASDGDLGKFLDPISFPGVKTDHAFAANSVIQIHTFLVTLIKQFEFSLLDDGHEAKGMKSSRFLVPIVVGEEHKGPQMPLKVTVLRNE